MDYSSFIQGIWLGGAISHFASLLISKKPIFVMKLIGALLWPIGMVLVLWGAHDTRRKG